jgi:hypothetical protein
VIGLAASSGGESSGSLLARARRGFGVLTPKPAPVAAPGQGDDPA